MTGRWLARCLPRDCRRGALVPIRKRVRRRARAEASHPIDQIRRLTRRSVAPVRVANAIRAELRRRRSRGVTPDRRRGGRERPDARLTAKAQSLLTCMRKVRQSKERADPAW
jgi:hypothetical protein